MAHEESMTGERHVSEALSQVLRSYDARDRQNMAHSRLGIRTSADIFEACQRKYEEAKVRRDTVRRRMHGVLIGEQQGESSVGQGRRGDSREEVVASAEKDVVGEIYRGGPGAGMRPEGG